MIIPFMILMVILGLLLSVVGLVFYASYWVCKWWERYRSAGGDA